MIDLTQVQTSLEDFIQMHRQALLYFTPKASFQYIGDTQEADYLNWLESLYEKDSSDTACVLLQETKRSALKYYYHRSNIPF